MYLYYYSYVVGDKYIAGNTVVAPDREEALDEIRRVLSKKAPEAWNITITAAIKLKENKDE